MRVAVVHNLQRGGALRRLQEQVDEMTSDVCEFTLSTGSTVTPQADVTPYHPKSEAVARGLRPATRYLDLAARARAWRECASRINQWGPDVVYAGPCQFEQAPGALRFITTPSVYYCDEPRRADYEAAARESTNPATRVLYAPLRAVERRRDRAAVASVGRLLTNSPHTAAAIRSAYGRDATVVRPRISAFFSPAGPRQPTHVLSVGTLIPSKGHDLAIEAVAASRVALPLQVVAPRPDRDEQARLQAIAETNGVTLLTRVGISDEALREAYRDALATLYLARSEPLGLVSLESQACGTPVVVSAEGGLPSTVDHGRSGWVVPRTGAAAGARLDEITAERRPALSAAALEQAEHWRRESGGEVLEALLAEAVA